MKLFPLLPVLDALLSKALTRAILCEIA